MIWLYLQSTILAARKVAIVCCAAWETASLDIVLHALRLTLQVSQPMRARHKGEDLWPVAAHLSVLADGEASGNFGFLQIRPAPMSASNIILGKAGSATQEIRLIVTDYPICKQSGTSEQKACTAYCSTVLQEAAAQILHKVWRDESLLSQRLLPW